MRRIMVAATLLFIGLGVLNAQATKAKTVKLAIAGMKCENCVTKVDKALRSVDGVKDVSVDLKKNSALVTLASADVKPEALFKAVDGAGFKAAIGKMPAAPEKKEENCDGCKEDEGKKEADAKKEDCCKPENTAKKKTTGKS